MKYAVLFLVLSVPAFAGTVKSFTCQTIPEEPGDPTPIKVVQFQRGTDGLYTLGYTKNLKETQPQALAEKLECRFRELKSCDFAKGFGCASESTEGLGPQTLVARVVTSCKQVDGLISIGNAFVPEIELSPLTNPGYEVITSRSSMHWLGYRFPQFPMGIFAEQFPMAFGCKAIVE